MKLILIRHGETKGNEDGIYQGRIDLSLSERGKDQCIEVKEKLKNIKVDKVYVSPLKRAKESAEIIFDKENREYIEELREIDFGLWEGLNYKKISESYSEEYSKFLNSYKDFIFPKGEGFNSFYLRVSKVIKIIYEKSKSEETVAIVAHGGTIRAIICELLKMDIDGFYNINVYHGCYSLLSVYDDMAIVEEINK
ncbi:alpha-ribazole phosphatase [Clostridium cavendishii DSM 21758]|uniref:Alpha-ribazole phosphatase n=1 Tax=Clostridium cavendishii DSM 21758 TaxID=1121302 RepID=A0A1M6T8T7_9CLOT|nr:alpha-ribazole phosphatase [Clostridium cavendishii]SHK53383.1 alpha-ribazole phosphatase [Clostridium cavendishii DSM 21758]